MRKLEVKNPEIVHTAIRKEIGRSKESRYLHRLHGVLLVTSGLSCRETAALLGRPLRTVEHWVRRFVDHGFAGLDERKRSGRPSRLDPSNIETLSADLERGPRSLGYDRTVWDGGLLSRHLRMCYGVELGVRQCQRILQQLSKREFRARSLNGGR